jgi:hypothetical protein
MGASSTILASKRMVDLSDSARIVACATPHPRVGDEPVNSNSERAVLPVRNLSLSNLEVDKPVLWTPRPAGSQPSTSGKVKSPPLKPLTLTFRVRRGLPPSTPRTMAMGTSEISPTQRTRRLSYRTSPRLAAVVLHPNDTHSMSQMSFTLDPMDPDFSLMKPKNLESPRRSGPLHILASPAG